MIALSRFPRAARTPHRTMSERRETSQVLVTDDQVEVA
jgi:hypothetical protein